MAIECIIYEQLPQAADDHRSPHFGSSLTMSRLDERLAALTTMTPVELRDEWQRVYRAPALRISPDLLARGIAWQLQERAPGGLPPSAARELKRLAQAQAADAAARMTEGVSAAGRAAGEADATGAAGPPGAGIVNPSPPRAPIKATALRPGTTLMRSWGDRSWTVIVTENGLVFEGRHYDSLSKIAREITGAHWSGPRFFGLTTARAQAHA